MQFGNLSAISMESAVNIPLTENLSSRIAFQLNADVYYYDYSNKQLVVTCPRFGTSPRADAYQPAYRQTDLHLSFVSASDVWRVSAVLNNLENEAIRSAAFPGDRVMLEAPRTYGITLKKNF